MIVTVSSATEMTKIGQNNPSLFTVIIKIIQLHVAITLSVCVCISARTLCACVVQHMINIG